MSSLNAEEARIFESVQTYYGKVLSTSKDLKTSACTTGSKPSAEVRKILASVPSEIKDKYYGCGSPFLSGIEGLTVLDLGSGSGRDCYIVSSLVGPRGHVIGVDMTEEQLAVARKYTDEYCTKTLGYDKSNMTFLKGNIEYLALAGVAKNSVDIVISNCVVNLSPDKGRVIQEVYDVLKEGGEFFFSDVYADRRLPDEVRKHDVLFGECLGGALYIEDFKRLCHKAGFADPRVYSMSTIEVNDPELKDLVGETKFYSITYRVFKLSTLETLCEDYGQVATYKGTIPGQKHSYKLDDGHFLETGRPILVCGNTASMLEESWLKPHFTISGDRSHHFGLFKDCGKPAKEEAALPKAVMGGCC